MAAKWQVKVQQEVNVGFYLLKIPDDSFEFFLKLPVCNILYDTTATNNTLPAYTL